MFMHKTGFCVQMHESCFKVHTNVQMQMSSITVFSWRFALLFDNATFDYFVKFPPLCWENFPQNVGKIPPICVIVIRFQPSHMLFLISTLE